MRIFIRAGDYRVDMRIPNDKDFFHASENGFFVITQDEKESNLKCSECGEDAKGGGYFIPFYDILCTRESCIWNALNKLKDREDKP